MPQGNPFPDRRLGGPASGNSRPRRSAGADGPRHLAPRLHPRDAPPPPPPLPPRESAAQTAGRFSRHLAADDGAALRLAPRAPPYALGRLYHALVHHRPFPRPALPPATLRPLHQPGRRAVGRAHRIEHPRPRRRPPASLAPASSPALRHPGP